MGLKVSEILDDYWLIDSWKLVMSWDSVSRPVSREGHDEDEAQVIKLHVKIGLPAVQVIRYHVCGWYRKNEVEWTAKEKFLALGEAWTAIDLLGDIEERTFDSPGFSPVQQKQHICMSILCLLWAVKKTLLVVLLLSRHRHDASADLLIYSRNDDDSPHALILLYFFKDQLTCTNSTL